MDLTSPDLSVSRRAVLAAGAGLAGTATLAACGNGGGSTSPGTKAAPGSDGAGSDGAGSNPTGETSSTTSGKGSAKGLVALADVPVGQAVSVTLAGGDAAVVARPTATTVACFSAICTHQGCTVKPAGATLDCPCHGSRYNALTGAVINGPAPRALPKIPVTVEGGQVVATT